MSGADPLFRFHQLTALAALIGQRGVTLGPLLADLSLDEGLRGEKAVVAPVSRVESLFARAAERAGIAGLGVALAESVPIGSFSTLEFATRSAPDVRRAYETFVAYRSVLNPAVSYLFTRVNGEGGMLELTVPGRAVGLGAHLNEYTLANLLRGTRAFTGQPVRPLRVAFAHPEPTDRAALEGFFDAPITYGALASRLELGGDVLALPLLSRDDALHAYLLDTLRARIVPVGSVNLATTVREHLGRVLGEQLSSVEDVAAALGMSARTLQRRLEEEGTSYSTVLDEVRRGRAEAYLANDRLARADLVHLLDFGSMRTFRRACARWFPGSS